MSSVHALSLSSRRKTRFDIDKRSLIRSWMMHEQINIEKGPRRGSRHATVFSFCRGSRVAGRGVGEQWRGAREGRETVSPLHRPSLASRAGIRRFADSTLTSMGVLGVRPTELGEE